MSYDYHMFDEVPPFPFTGHNSPLFSRKIESAYFATLNMAWSAEHWVELGVHREKIMVGIPTYARTYTLARADLHGLDAPATGSGPGPQGSVDYPWVSGLGMSTPFLNFFFLFRKSLCSICVMLHISASKCYSVL